MCCVTRVASVAYRYRGSLVLFVFASVRLVVGGAEYASVVCVTAVACSPGGASSAVSS